MQITPVSELLDRLLRSYVHSDGSEYSYSEIARAIKDQFGEEIASSYIGKVRSGAIENPGHHALLLLCAFFQVPASYFYPDLEQVLAPGTAPTPEQLLRQALHAMQLPEDVQQHLIGMVLALYQHQQQALMV